MVSCDDAAPTPDAIRAIAADLMASPSGRAFLDAYAAETLASERAQRLAEAEIGDGARVEMLRRLCDDARRDLGRDARRGSSVAFIGRFAFTSLVRAAVDNDASLSGLAMRLAALLDAVESKLETTAKHDSDALADALRDLLTDSVGEPSRPAPVRDAVVEELALALAAGTGGSRPQLRLASSTLATNCSADARQPCSSA